MRLTPTKQNGSLLSYRELGRVQYTLGVIGHCTKDGVEDVVVGGRRPHGCLLVVDETAALTRAAELIASGGAQLQS